MTIEAWPFLVGRNKDLGYQTIVSPQFLSEADLAGLLAEAVGGDYSGLGSATYREILGSPVGDMSLVFRVVKAKAQDYGLGGEEVLFDRSGRSIRLIEGFVIRGSSGGLRVSRNDFQITHEIVKDVYYDFWQAKTTFEGISSQPFELSAENQESQQLRLIEEPPMDLRSRKAIESISQLGRMGTTSDKRVSVKNQVSQRPLIGVAPSIPTSPYELQQRRRRNLLLAVLVMLLIVLIVIIIPVIFSHPTSSNCASGSITVGGSTALQPLVSQAAQSYQTMCSQATISVNQGVATSEAGLRQAEAENIQIADSELQSSKADLVDHPVAIAIFVLVLNRDVTGITSLTTAQIQGIYNGSITNWQQVGGPDLPIYVVSLTSTSGTRSVFEKYVLKAPESLELSQTHIEVDATGVMGSTVANTSGAIGYVDLGTATKQNLPIVQIDGIEASSGNVEGGSYNFWTVEHMYTKGNPSGLTSAFLDYMVGDQVKGMVRNLSYLAFNDVSSDRVSAHSSPIAPGGL